MKRIFVCIISPWILSLITYLSGYSHNDAKSADKVLIGAIRWDAWHTTPAMNKENNEQGGAVKAVERSLSPKRYHFRVPFFGKILSDSVIKIDGYNQTILDQEIEFARQGGLDYWGFSFI